MRTLRFQDLACPNCGQRESFHVDVTATAYLDGSGLSVEGGYCWNSDLCCTCLGCHFEASAGDFTQCVSDAEKAALSKSNGGAQ